MAHKILYGKVSDIIFMMNRKFRDIAFLIQNINKQKVNNMEIGDACNFGEHPVGRIGAI